ncbi:hypothetical protein ADUPG1_009757 [Aduncisulcus paluster]|uniref:Rhodanese domain-containing protein n=1 Tax=Aduncisulcus paluster TaxID=2918883 RepID=A0ABQ5KWS2_9EUKA|nr:hypothetical protein ADUPG1_009757 [Aduncisulcus paluster]
MRQSKNLRFKKKTPCRRIKISTLFTWISAAKVVASVPDTFESGESIFQDSFVPAPVTESVISMPAAQEGTIPFPKGTIPHSFLPLELASESDQLGATTKAKEVTALTQLDHRPPSVSGHDARSFARETLDGREAKAASQISVSRESSLIRLAATRGHRAEGSIITSVWLESGDGSKKEMTLDSDRGFCLVDVRDGPEYEKFHIWGSHSLPFSRIRRAINPIPSDLYHFIKKETTTIVVIGTEAWPVLEGCTLLIDRGIPIERIVYCQEDVVEFLSRFPHLSLGSDNPFEGRAPVAPPPKKLSAQERLYRSAPKGEKKKKTTIRSFK